MRDDRTGENLWIEWDGYELPTEFSDSTTYFTYSWVDLDIDVVRRALASALQHSGSVDGLGSAFRALDSSHVIHGHAAHIGGEHEWSFYDSATSAEEAGDVSDETAMTWVEIDLGKQ